ncbi:MAG: methyltransferase domain-containing protein [Chloroflexota bacterium]
MNIEYQETSKDLQARIDIHKKYGSRDIDQWMLELLQPARGSAILDVACGSGKQLLAFHNFLQGEAEITGGDVSAELLAEARRVSQSVGGRIRVTELDFNRRLDFEEASLDLVSCCFAIYYAADIPFTIGEMHRVLKPGGRLFTTGPMPENKRLFYEVIQEATGRPIPPMPGSSRYSTEILEAMRRRFGRVEVHIFENPLAFDGVEPFMTYTRASLSEDRRLWGSFFQGQDEFEAVLSKIETAAARRLARDGRLVMTKVVGGFVAHKQA